MPGSVYFSRTVAEYRYGLVPYSSGRADLSRRGVLQCSSPSAPASPFTSLGFFPRCALCVVPAHACCCGFACIWAACFHTEVLVSCSLGRHHRCRHFIACFLFVSADASSPRRQPRPLGGAPLCISGYDGVALRRFHRIQVSIFPWLLMSPLRPRLPAYRRCFTRRCFTAPPLASGRCISVALFYRLKCLRCFTRRCSTAFPLSTGTIFP